MTREKAIKKYIIPALNRTWNENMCKEILEALEQEPCGDCVSREAVIEILENYGCTNKEGLLFKDIRALPPVHPTREHGEWITEWNEHEREYFDKCSVCGRTVIRGVLTKIYAYCPRCGARMIEPLESEEVSTQENLLQTLHTLESENERMHDVLDKLRAEMEALEYLSIEDGSDGYDKYIERYEVLNIIDKYRKEQR